jgi:hypothetical protein
MDDPVSEISSIITTLCTGTLASQQAAVECYFLPSAAFHHPICRTLPSTPYFLGRDQIHSVYSWYKALSPDIAVQIRSVAFDEKNGKLYVNLVQSFRLWIVPRLFYPRGDYELVTVLTLEQDVDNGKWWIRTQEDLYQTEQWVQFVVPWIGRPAVLLYTWIAMALLLLSNALIGKPVRRIEERSMKKKL